MKRITHICLAVLLLHVAIDAKAQSKADTRNSSGSSTMKSFSASKAGTSKPVLIKKPKPIHTELSFGLRLNTDGWSILVDKGWVKSEEKARDFFYDLKLLQVEFGEKKDPSQIKRANTTGSYSDDKPKPFVYGKKNNFYTFKIGYGGRKMLAGKPEPGNVSMHLVYVGGLSLGLLKPYYLTALAPVAKNSADLAVQDITYTDTTSTYFLDKNYIVGSSGFSKGLGETKIIPGVHLKLALHFDFAASKKSVLAVETGANLEYYTKAIELMANKDASAFFLNAFVSIQFGKRW